MTTYRFRTTAAQHAARRAWDRYRVVLDANGYDLLCDRIAFAHEAKLICGCSPYSTPPREAWLVLHPPHGWMVAVWQPSTQMIVTFLPLSTQFTASGVQYWDREKYPEGLILEAIDEGG